MITEILLPQIEQMIQKAYNQEQGKFITFGGLAEELEDLELHGHTSDMDNAEIYYQKKNAPGAVWFKANNPEELDNLYYDLLDGVYTSELEYIEESIPEKLNDIKEEYNSESGIIRTNNFIVRIEPGEGVIEDSFYIRKGDLDIQCDMGYINLKEHLLKIIKI